MKGLHKAPPPTKNQKAMPLLLPIPGRVAFRIAPVSFVRYCLTEKHDALCSVPGVYSLALENDV